MSFNETVSLLDKSIGPALDVSGESLLIFFFSSLVIGLVCLTIYFYFSKDKKLKEWKNLKDLEKIIFGFLVGGITLLSSMAFLSISVLNSASLWKLIIILPFFHFYFVYYMVKEFHGLEFIKQYLILSTKLFYIFLSFFYVFLFIKVKNYVGLIVPLVLLLGLLFNHILNKKRNHKSG
jgi:hypothetical protein